MDDGTPQGIESTGDVCSRICKEKHCNEEGLTVNPIKIVIVSFTKKREEVGYS